MRKERTLDFQHVTIRVHEPTMEKIRSILSQDRLSFDPVGYLSGRCEIPADLVGLFTDASPEAIKQLTLSEFKEVLDAIRELLAPFLEILEMLGTVSGYLRGMHEEISTEPSAS